MRHTTPTDIALRTARQHPGVRQLPDLDGFDCELPDDARNELLAPKRARMLGRPIQRMPRRWLKRLSSFVVIIVTPFAVFALLLGIITLCGIGTHSHTPGRDILLERTFHPMPAPTPVVQPPVVQAPAPREEVRRAELVPVAVKRAALWRLPTQPLGVYEWYPLPEVWGGGRVWARYMGTVERFSQIPPNPIPGDLWNVTETGASWIHCVPMGYDHAVWIDP